MSLATSWAGLRRRRALLVPCAVLCAGVLAAQGGALALTGTRTAVQACAPMVLLALGCAGALGSELAAARRLEAGVAAVRGARGIRLLRFLLLEPLAAVLLGAVAGVPLAVLLAGRISQRSGARSAVPWDGAGGVVLAVVTLLLFLAGAAGALRRRPLFEQLSPVLRRREAGAAVTFLSLLVALAALLAAYRAGTGATAAHDWLVAAGPALAGLVSGAVASMLITAVGRLGAVAGNSRLATWLGSRGLARRGGSRPATVLGVAALVVAFLAADHLHTVQAWVDDSARLAGAAPVQVPYDGSAVSALHLTHEIDPQGRYLMAAQVSADAAPDQRIALLDLDRYDRVAAPFLADTPASAIAGRVPALVDGVPAPVGDGSGLVVEGLTPGPAAQRLSLGVDYVDDVGNLATVVLAVRPAPDRAFTARARVADCAGGCSVSAVRVLAEGGPGRTRVVLHRLELAGSSLLGLPWHGAPGGDVRAGPGTLALTLTSGSELSVRPVAALPVVTTPGVTMRPGGTVPGTGGDGRTPRRVGTVAALPFLHAAGVLADLRLAALGSAPSPPGARVVVLARADTPPAVLSRVPGADAAVRLGAWEQDVRDSAEVVNASLYGLAGLAALLALAMLLRARRQRLHPLRIEEATALRRVGVPDATLRRARLLEALRRTTVAVGAAVVGWLVCREIFGETLALVRLSGHALPLGGPFG